MIQDIQDLYNYLAKVRDVATYNGLQSISPGVDIAYEAGRRIGVRQGMDQMLVAFNEFQTKKDDDKEAKL